MKKIVLILLIILYSVIGRSQGYYYYDSSYNHFKFNIGISPGFQFVKSDSAFVTVAALLGLNYRRYLKNNDKLFLDFDFSAMPIILDQRHYTSFGKLSLGFGVLGPQFDLSYHVTFAHSFSDKKNLVGIGYNLESSSIPITVEASKFIKGPGYLLLIGIKVPLTLPK